jgi:hypothetical protein
VNMGPVVGMCRGCNAQHVREAYTLRQDINDALGKRRVIKHTAVVKKNRQDPGSICGGYIVPHPLYPPPARQVMSLDAYQGETRS